MEARVCGIAGIIDYAGRFSTPELQRLTIALRDAQAHRGPDDAGLWTGPDGRVCLGHRRLAVLDLRPEGRQPMTTGDGSVALTFNGEIYNYRGLRSEAENAGKRFKTRTDSEVLCHLLESDPDEVVERLNGMFALAAWRPAARELVLARDALGKKPLYYVREGGFVAFASELRPLELLGHDLLGGVDPVAIQEYLLLQYIHAPRTIYRRVRKLEPGTLLRVRLRGEGSWCVERRFFSFEAREPDEPALQRAATTEFVEPLRARLIDAVGDRLVSDVPLGAFLSGGNDSSLVVAVMARELGVRPKTFSVGFADAPESEHHAARTIAECLDTDHHELVVEPSAVEMLPEIVAALDEPNGDSSCLPIYLLSRFARQHVTVALSGDGGDEIFGGYGRYAETIREATSWRRRVGWSRRHRRWWTPGRAYLSERILPMTADELTRLSGRLEPETTELLHHFRAVADGSGPVLHRLRTLDASTYLPGAVLAKVDRMAMRFALEVRCPLLDVRLARWASSLPAHVLHDGITSKKVLKELARCYLPAEIVDRPKQGFGLPAQCWSRERLLDLADSLLVGNGSTLAGYLDQIRLRRHLARQRVPGAFNVYQVWELLVLEQWLRGTARALPLAA
jgi:asparagine synthase (glutamine-hydrolysing)